MNKNSLEIPEIKLVGISIITNNKDEFIPENAKIGNIMHKYFSNNTPSTILNRKKPGVTYCVYTNYESDHNGNYTYFIGEEVLSFEGQPDVLIRLNIPAQQYTKFTSEKGKMPDVCINTWQKIWQTKPEELHRSYIADFEMYDERSADLQNAVLDIYIGIK